MPCIILRKLASLVLCLGLLFGCDLQTPNALDQVERAVIPSVATPLVLKSVSEEHRQTRQWRIRFPGSWAEYEIEVAARLTRRGFDVERSDESLLARKTAVGDYYYVEIRPLSVLGNQTMIEISAVGGPF